MIMKKLSKEKLTDLYLSLQKRRKKIKTRSILLASFVLGVNIFAWFVFISMANVKVEANVISWDVNFSDSSEIISNIVIETPKLYPGMPTYTKEFFITNSSDVGGTFSYTINSINVLGEEMLLDTSKQDEAQKYLKETFPFIITFNSSKMDLADKDNLRFTISIDWPYESTDLNARDYYRLTSHYKYDPTIAYYSLNNSVYNKVENVTEEMFETNKTNYFIEKDDADSFWGATCQKYKDSNNETCFSFKLLLRVIQNP